jgi:ABC-type uncharacterized transport system auxiliary subunit
MKHLILFLAVLTSLCACGNDKNVEAKFIEQINNATKTLSQAKSVDDIVKANDLQAEAYKLQGVEELSESDNIKQALDNFENELDKAQKRILEGLQDEFLVSSELVADSVGESNKQNGEQDKK